MMPAADNRSGPEPCLSVADRGGNDAVPVPALGAMLAVAVLAGAMTVFGVALRLMDRAFAAGRRTMLPGVVAGFRNWSDDRLAKPASSAPAGPAATPTETGIELVELVDRRIDD